jgi:hypothetical protein
MVTLPTVVSRRAPNCDDYSYATLHCMTLYMYSLLILIRAFPPEGRTSVQRGYVATTILARVLMRTVLPVPPGTYMYAQLIELAR